MAEHMSDMGEALGSILGPKKLNRSPNLSICPSAPHFPFYACPSGKRRGWNLETRGKVWNSREGHLSLVIRIFLVTRPAPGSLLSHVLIPLIS